MTKPPPPKSAIKAAKGISTDSMIENLHKPFKLLDNELVYKTTAGYIIYDRMMAEWLRSLTF